MYPGEVGCEEGAGSGTGCSVADFLLVVLNH
jgi:hypothetical protein